ncbi:MAG: hypothetical protein AAGJ97_15265 [Planctomycetota bacterium]
MTKPPRPLVASPVVRVTLPELPFLEVPEAIPRQPETPALPELPLAKTTPPDEVCVLSPEETRTEPP